MVTNTLTSSDIKKGHVGSEQWHFAWLRAARAPCGAELAAAGGMDDESPELSPAPTAASQAPGARLGLSGEDTAYA